MEQKIRLILECKWHSLINKAQRAATTTAPFQDSSLATADKSFLQQS